MACPTTNTSSLRHHDTSPPPEVLQVNGSVTSSSALIIPSSGNTTFDGPASVTFDFGRNIAGIVSLGIGSSSTCDAFIGVTFTEPSLWTSSQACEATADSGLTLHYVSLLAEDLAHTRPRRSILVVHSDT
ncbi:hypothetical protein ETB97_000735 [Aspergillus alliaceus]|uniref:Uncharacterized protein n=1 Tax=Petromyces alliaceus TaxID=209559 RepID=A0A8H6AFI8_PETAA|nr:hypothetical protein ETB97_000735 [Aspergillus burnettii]